MRRPAASARRRSPRPGPNNSPAANATNYRHACPTIGSVSASQSKGECKMRDLEFSAERLAPPTSIAIPFFRQLIYPTRGMVTANSRAAYVPLAASQWGVGHDWTKCISFFRCFGNHRRTGRMRTRKRAVSEPDVAADSATDLRDLRLHSAIVVGCQCLGDD